MEFLNFYPRLVGGHCIGIDPYYLTYKCKQIGFNPKLILAGRQINNYLPKYISNKIKKRFRKNKKVKGIILGATFKENCKDIRNSGSQKYTIISKIITKLMFMDPLALPEDCKKIYKKSYVKKLNKNYYDFIIIAVGHDYFKKWVTKKLKNYQKKKFLHL